jgi:hypothetical protein
MNRIGGLETGSWAEVISACSSLGALIAAVLAVRWAAQAAREARQQAHYASQQVAVAQKELVEARAANSLPVLIELFAEHRSAHLIEARDFVYHKLPKLSTPNGLQSLSRSKRRLVIDLLFFYDNLGNLVAHGVVDLPPVSAYLGGSLQTVWELVYGSIVEPERNRRAKSADANRWQAYFENLYVLTKQHTPAEFRRSAPQWVLDDLK